MHFDYEKLAQEAKIPQDKLIQLKKTLREEFPRDEMMYELHLLRICMSIKEGDVSLDEALRPPQAA